MIIFVGSKEKGYFCEDVAAKFDQAVEYIDTDIHIVNQIAEIMNYKENCEYLVVDVEQYADDADVIIDSLMKVKEAVNTKIIIYAVAFSPKSELLSGLYSRGIRNYIFSEMLSDKKKDLTNCINGFYEQWGYESLGIYFEGEDEDNAEEGSFNSKPLWARMAIVVAGPFFNFILAFLLALIVIGYNGVDISYVSKVTEGSNAYEAGLRQGDRITKYNGATVSVGREIYLEDYVSPLDGSDISVTFVRDGKKQTISYAPDSEERYIVGISYYETDPKATISSVPKGSAMDQAGVVAGDEVVEINGTKISTGKDLKEYIDAHPFGKEEINITVKRNNKEKKVVVVPQMTKLYSSGFVYNLARDKQSVGGVLKYSLVEVRYEINTVLKSLKMLVTGKVSANEVSGPVGIVNVIGDTYNQTKSEGFMVTLFTMINMAIMLSANLGVMNLLPIPALDGGRLFLYIVELIIRRPIPKDKEGMIHFIGFILLMVLMVFLIFNDIRKIIL